MMLPPGSTPQRRWLSLALARGKMAYVLAPTAPVADTLNNSGSKTVGSWIGSPLASQEQ
jgi:hypothetical protein